MTTPVIIDIVVVVFLAAAALYGAYRGLLRSLAGLVILVVALVGAGIIAGTFSGPAAKLVTPLISSRIEEKVADALADQTGAQAPEVSGVPQEDTGLSVEELLSLLGLDEEVRRSMADRAEEKVRDTGAAITEAVVESLAQSMIYGVLYILSFVGLTLLLRVLVGAMGLVLKLPGLHLLNTLGGGILGLAQGVLLVFLLIWAARHLGVSFDTETLATAHILQIFTTNTPLRVLTFLQ